MQTTENDQKREPKSLSSQVILAVVIAFIKVMVVLRAAWLSVKAIFRQRSRS